MNCGFEESAESPDKEMMGSSFCEDSDFLAQERSLSRDQEMMMIPVVGESFLFTQQQHDTQDSEVIIYLSIGQTCFVCSFSLWGASKRDGIDDFGLDSVRGVGSSRPWRETRRVDD